MSDGSTDADAPAGTPRFAELVLAPNPGPMTLDGTNSWVLRSPGQVAVLVVDPGPSDDAHLERLARHGEVAAVLLTHGHRDHAEGMPRFREMTGAPVHAVDPSLCRDTEPLRDGDEIEAGGVRVRVLATPGHSSDSATFVASAHGGTAVLTGDTVLGRGSTVVAAPDGRLDDYLATLARLQALGALTVLPGHGPVRGDLAARAAEYLAHRAQRLDEVRAALAAGARTSDEVLEAVYADVDPAVRFAAAMSVEAQLTYLRDHPA